MNLRKWFFLFWTTMAIGAVVTSLTGSILAWTDPSFDLKGLKGAGFNAGMMALTGLLFGAFAHMGFFAYLTLNYIALGIFRRGYLWTTLQAYTTLFGIVLFGYRLYENREALNGWIFWALPAFLTAAAWCVALVKTKQTNKNALFPTLFLLIVGTVLEAWPSMSDDNNLPALIFMIVPLFACNAYQILMLHKLVKPAETGSGASAKPVA
ncbi:MAG TPA: KinB-signaling pathway activation protein [Paenibacillus sp.]|uniref:KinB-signaling pathway activation protein n=1 Tax=Paenibacillus sp. TaxID=58172 RepID=UPI0028D5C175|nr:KinB-signaling pathway activation protein [Paenibacillus sp.]HUC91756.1 KinB-signaling pathway activation protein [Paenibacillus sp.]